MVISFTGLVVGGEAATGEDVEAKVVASLSPFIDLPGQIRADEPDDRVSGKEDPDGVGASTDLPVQAFGGTAGPDATPGTAKWVHQRLSKGTQEFPHLLPAIRTAISNGRGTDSSTDGGKFRNDRAYTSPENGQHQVQDVATHRPDPVRAAQ